MSRLRSYGRLPRESAKVKKNAPDFRKVYAEVDARSEGRCEWTDPHETAVADLGGGDVRPLLVRCLKRATEHHHTVKPRRSPLNHRPDFIIHLCPGHHDRCSWPFKRGRATALALGEGLFRCSIRYAASKFEARGQGA